MTEPERHNKQICRECDERPQGCWKARDYGCTCEYRAAESEAAKTSNCPLLKLARPAAADVPAGETIDLPGVTTVVYTTAKNVALQQRVGQMLESRGFTDWRFCYGAPYAGTGDFRAAVARDYAAILRKHAAPLLLLEDDVALRAWTPRLRLPPGAQGAMLGGGRRGSAYAVNRAAKLFPQLRRAHGYGYLPIDGEWMRVFGMFWTHAYLWLDPAAMLEAAEALVAYDRAADQTLAREQWRWQVACRIVPVFWQDDGRHYWDTFDYAPPPAAPPEPRADRISRLRARRQAVLAR
jgi:hypothetical protein